MALIHMNFHFASIHEIVGTDLGLALLTWWVPPSDVSSVTFSPVVVSAGGDSSVPPWISHFGQVPLTFGKPPVILLKVFPLAPCLPVSLRLPPAH